MCIFYLYKENPNKKYVTVTSSNGKSKTVSLDLNDVKKSKYLTENEKMRVHKFFGEEYQPKVKTIVVKKYIFLY